MNKRNSGFTLIEMLIVVGIIGILSSIVLVGLGRSRYAGRDARRVADLGQVQNGLELYYSKCGIYPGDKDCVATTNPSTWAGLVTVLKEAGIGVTNVSNDPTPTKNYSYGVSSGNQSYVLMATLDDANNSALKDDVDGTDVYTVNCNDPNYCIQF